MKMSVKGRDWSRHLWALGAGVLLFLSFPKFGTGFLAWVALVPLFMAVSGQAAKKAFGWGFLSGLIAHLGILYWIAYVVVKYGNLPWPVGIGALLLLACYMGLYTAIFASGVAYAESNRLPLMCFAPTLWTSLEYIKTHAFTGFPWALLGYSQFKFPFLLQISDITGVYGISFLIVLVNAFFYEFFFTRRRQVWRVACVVLLLAIVSAYGVYRMNEIEKRWSLGEELKVAVVQGNVDQSVKWNPAYQHATMADYLSLTEKVAREETRLVVWPETATPFFYQDPSPYKDLIGELVKRKKVWLLFGSPSYRREKDDRITIFNSVYLLNQQGVVQGRYDKVHLVPYGEYVPLRSLFPFIGKLVQGIGDFGTGPGYIPLEMGEAKVGVLICYEAIFPAAARTYAKMGANLLVNVTNDAWFGRTSAPYQHLSMAILRAVENKTYLVRAANTGISAIIDPLGRLEQETQLFEPATISGPVKLTRESTFYGRQGDIFSFGCLGFAFLGILNFWRRKGK
ncbi:MAG TPA: apolipoprotein N-acyltransferase [Syntrophales bacterium]|nr:apolipoprotein N-acyltransferase [Syntrophales bacterium]HOL59690.1 apolipoprotein N-acyltransferase [Syntrophales bacterium]HPO35836.1 apolipoprotein N-acyltransferase [Syntrophales bacterium]